jgi:hypothetical protein
MYVCTKLDIYVFIIDINKMLCTSDAITSILYILKMMTNH